MVDPGQAAVGIVVMLVVVGAFLYIFYSRTNSVEKTGYGALIMLSLVSLMIPVFWIMESNGETMYKIQQHTQAVQKGATLYATYCFQCHGTKGQGIGGKGNQLNGSTTVNNLNDADLIRILDSGVYDPTNPGAKAQALMPAFNQLYNGPLTDDDIQYLFELIRSADSSYLSKNGYPTGTGSNGFDQVANDIQGNSPSAYATAVAQETAGQFGVPVDMTKQTAITINIVDAPSGASCSPACFNPINIKVKVGTKITWVNKSSTIHTVSAIDGPTTKKLESQLFDSGVAKGIPAGGTYLHIVTMADYKFDPTNHIIYYYCQYHPTMLAELIIVQ